MKYIYLDTETTGIEENDRIIQLAYLVYDEDGKSELFQTFCTTDQQINFKAMAVHHITPEMLDGYPELVETDVYKHLITLNTPDNYFVAQNADFDLKMLEKEGFHNHMKVIDTLKIARNILPDLDGHSEQFLRYRLGLYKDEPKIMQQFGIKEIAAHDAIGDILVLKLLLDHLKNVNELNSRLKAMELLRVVLDLNRMTYGDFEKYPLDDQFFIISQLPTLIKKFKFGKYKEKDIQMIVHKDPGYIDWMLNKMDNLNDDIRFTISFHRGEININEFVTFPKYTPSQPVKPNQPEPQIEVEDKTAVVEQLSIFDMMNR